MGVNLDTLTAPVGGHVDTCCKTMVQNMESWFSEGVDSFDAMCLTLHFSAKQGWPCHVCI